MQTHFNKTDSNCFLVIRGLFESSKVFILSLLLWAKLISVYQSQLSPSDG